MWLTSHVTPWCFVWWPSPPATASDHIRRPKRIPLRRSHQHIAFVFFATPEHISCAGPTNLSSLSIPQPDVPWFALSRKQPTLAAREHQDSTSNPREGTIRPSLGLILHDAFYGSQFSALYRFCRYVDELRTGHRVHTRWVFHVAKTKRRTDNK